MYLTRPRPVKFAFLPKIILIPGIYQTRTGKIVAIDQVFPEMYYAEGSFPSGVFQSWDVCGRINPKQLTDIDIVRHLTAT